MVFQEESTSRWFWPLRRSNSEDKKEFNALGDTSSDDDTWEQERAFEIADSVEKGLAREIVSEFMHPLRRSNKLWRFHVVRSEDKLQYRLFSDDGDFLMYARADIDAGRVEFFSYNPSEKEEKLYDPTRPAFLMTFNKDKTEWRITQERSEGFLRRRGKQQVAFAKHGRTPVGDGIFNCMDVTIPGQQPDGSSSWCPALRQRQPDGTSSCDSGGGAQALITKKPVWNEEVESLVLDFKGRRILPSAKNFQLALASRPDQVVCQYGKIGPSTFSLDFKFPLSVIQAFGLSLSTLMWT
jgi:hypothetical protein